jgi:hypothetical protein
VKKLLIMLILSLCAVAWRSDDIINALINPGFMPAFAGPASVQSMIVSHQYAGQHAMTIDELSGLSKTDPKAARKFIDSRTVNEPTAADKLMNFLSHGKYQ